MKENGFIKFFNYLIDGILNVYLNNPISKKIKVQKIDEVLTIVDLNKVKEITVEHFTTKDTVFLNQDKVVIEEYLKNFIKTMNENFEEEDLRNLYDNITWLLVKRNRFLKSDGEYEMFENILTFHKNNDPDSINHELMHLSSNPHDENNFSGGFSHSIENDILIGRGIDEGYTELLNIRYFNSKAKNTYEREVFAVSEIEKLVGQKEMEKYYLNANLYRLIKALEKYYSLQEIERFICSLDFINIYDEKKLLSDIELEECFVQLDNIIIFLFKGFIKNLDKNTKNIKEIIINYINLLKDRLDYDIDEYLLQCFNKIIDDELSNLNTNIILDINIFKNNENVL
ncbi:MAG: hypothetical protein IKL65_01615 [Bacilli bacterium]|nr:hypothetical protein [Bacilli bacterium]